VNLSPGFQKSFARIDEPPPAIKRMPPIRPIAFYLPQFHPVPENDEWWGKGFTEWTNVTKARPLFEGHYQPHLPADFGFYDLRLREVQREQIACAKKYGLDVFCFHYYWFAGRRILERPVDDFLADREARIQFCLCWANENWTRKWDASEHEVLIAQSYSPTNDIAFIEGLLPYFRDDRYLRIDGAPVLVVYRPQQLPDPKATAARWRRVCREAGIGEIHLVAALTHGNWEFESLGFDAGVEFPPHNVRVRDRKDDLKLYEPIGGWVERYGEVAERYLAHDYRRRLIYRGVYPSWDNTARVNGGGLITLDSTPDNYERWLNRATHRTLLERQSSQRLLFINAWNEWAEGCHLEPDRRYGSAFLEATLRAKERRSTLHAAFPVDKASEQVMKTEPRPPNGKLVRRPLVHRIARLLRTNPKLYHAAQIAWREMLALWARARLIAASRLPRG